MRSNNPLVKNFKVTATQEDFEFKRLLFNIVVILYRNPMMNEVCFIYLFLLSQTFPLQLITHSRVLVALLSYIEPLPRQKNRPVNTFEWKISQIEDLQLHALVVLSILLPYSLNEYFEYRVSAKLLAFYEWTVNNGKKKFFLFYS